MNRKKNASLILMILGVFVFFRYILKLQDISDIERMKSISVILVTSSIITVIGGISFYKSVRK